MIICWDFRNVFPFFQGILISQGEIMYTFLIIYYVLLLLFIIIIIHASISIYNVGERNMLRYGKRLLNPK